MNYPLALLVMALGIGIVLGNYVDISEFYRWGLFAIACCGLSFFLYHGRLSSRFSRLFSVTAILTMISFGMILVTLHDPTHRHEHYTQRDASVSQDTEATTVQFYLKERLTPSAYDYRYYAEVLMMNGKPCSGTIIIRIRKEGTPFHGKIGAVYTTVTSLKAIPSPKNPGQFDYATYLKRRYVYHQVSIVPEQLIAHQTHFRSIFYYAAFLRDTMYQRMQSAGFTSTQLSMINALFFGQRQDLSRELYAAYRDAGVVHILAISGLHIGILLWILQWVLHPLYRIGRWGSALKIVLILGVLWGFAIVSGLSISVVRAVLMFSSMSIALHLRSSKSTYNAVLVSAFVVLCAHPMAIFEVGFQLSYCAVLGIVWGQPILYRQFQTRWYGINYLWKLISVTLAAQLAVLPLTIWYFHQFPALFLVSNIILLPTLGIVLCLGILCILCGALGYIPSLCSAALGKSIDSCTAVATWVASQEYAVIAHISCTLPMVLLGYGVVITTLQTLHTRCKRWYQGMQLIIIAWCLVWMYTQYQQYQSSALYIHYRYGDTLISVQEKGQLYGYSEGASSTDQKVLERLAVAKGLQLHEILPLRNSYRYQNKTLLRVDQYGIYPKNIQPDVVLLSENPKLHLDRLLEALQPKYVIADGSNTPKMITYWKKTCRYYHISFYDLRKTGCFVLQ